MATARRASPPPRSEREEFEEPIEVSLDDRTPAAEATAPQPLEDRIRSALTEDGSINSARLADLLGETEEAIRAADEAVAGWWQRAENIFTGDAAEALGNRDTWCLIAARLRGALPKLQRKLVDVRNAEDYARWLVQYEATKAELDAACADLKAHYPPWVSYLCTLLAKIKAIDEAVLFVNNNKPQHALGDSNTLRSVECTAKGVDDLGRNKSIVKDLVLPAWELSELAAYPPYHNHAAELAMMQSRMYDRRDHPLRYTADWAQAQETQQRQRAAAEQEEKDRLARQPVPHGADWGERRG